jgi:hypothetical protein
MGDERRTTGSSMSRKMVFLTGLAAMTKICFSRRGKKAIS